MEAIVEYNYVAQEPDELTLRKGDIITEIRVLFGGWWEGKLRDKRGMFPDNFVKVLEPTSGTGTTGSSSDASSSGRSEEVSLRNNSGRKWCKVLFSYDPCNPDELTLVPGDSIEFLGEVEQGWWRGRLRGRVGVFPSNFVGQPTSDEPEKHKAREKREICRVLYPYKPDNEDELALVEGDIITILSRDAPDKGWWKGELRGQIGLFPDNFVEIINAKNEPHEPPEQRHEMSTKSSPKYSHQVEKAEKTHIRKNLDVLNFHSEHTTSTETTTKKSSISTTPSSTTSSTSPGAATGTGEKKSMGSHSIISSFKRLVNDAGTNNGNGNTSVALGEELDGVERGEGSPLSHLTASRAKAPRRRLPSSQRLRRHAGGTLPTSQSTASEDSLTNGNTDNAMEQMREEESESLAATAKRKAPWAQELKLNHLERRKMASLDRVDKPEIKKERNFSRLSSSATEFVIKSEPEPEESKQKDKDRGQRSGTSPSSEHAPTVPSSPPAYVPYALYSQLLERVAALEETQAALQQQVGQLSEQLIPLLANASLSSKD